MFARPNLNHLTVCVGLAAASLVILPAAGGRAADASGLANLMADHAIAGDAPGAPDQPPPREGTPVPPTWTLTLKAFPDTVGVNGYACPGCDGVFSDGDRIAAAGRPLQPLLVAVTEPGNAQNTYWIGLIDRSRESNLELQTEVVLHVPPPYQVNLITVNPFGYTLCPNSRPAFVATQDDFDATSGTGRPDSGRSLRKSWYFWSCRTLVPESR